MSFPWKLRQSKVALNSCDQEQNRGGYWLTKQLRNKSDPTKQVKKCRQKLKGTGPMKYTAQKEAEQKRWHTQIIRHKNYFTWGHQGQVSSLDRIRMTTKITKQEHSDNTNNGTSTFWSSCKESMTYRLWKLIFLGKSIPSLQWRRTITFR